ncbi:MAG: methyltransferase domain-containing protein [Thiotrichaceae bacterium]
MSHLAHRTTGYELLQGKGLEIGALHQPAALPSRCEIEYCDAHSQAESFELFPELVTAGFNLVDVTYVRDIDKGELMLFSPDSYDFVVLNHVIEHVANPINTVRELFRIVKPTGHVVISAPDKNFCFDKNRALTSFYHLIEEYRTTTTEITDAHYVDFLCGVHSEALRLDDEMFEQKLMAVKKRREHAHVWDSHSFSAFMNDCLNFLHVRAECQFLSLAEQNQSEYFSVWKKLY